MDSYFTIKKSSEGIYKEKGSRFISLLIPVDSEDVVKEQFKRIRAKFHDARHVCFAYRVGLDKQLLFRSNDDGEPGGTAGKPIMNVLLENKLDNAMIVVVRYFGGVKLGTPGLINAYRTASQDAVENNLIEEKQIESVHTIYFQYNMLGDVERIIKDFDVFVLKRYFSETCIIHFSVIKAVEIQVLQKISDLRVVKIDG